MNNLLSTLYPSPKTISPTVLSKPVVENVPSNNYLHRTLNYATAPTHSRSSNADYCTTLPPSPKDHLTHDPTCTKSCKFPNRPFKRGKCYMLYSPQQNIWGPVCGDGGSNANWVRGNRFGVDYQYDTVFNRKDYAVDVPRFNKKNPILVSDSPYYPFKDYPLRFDPKYKSYPYKNNYIDGKPTYMYPYETLAKPTRTQVCSTNIETFGNIEQFGNVNCPYTWIIVILLVVLFMIYNK